jgi:hypothetical protein
VLEPSAGIGGLAVYAKMAGAEVAVNELSKRRLKVLRHMPFDHFFNENAEHLDNILPTDIKPTLVIMNPPFSSTAGRMQGQRKTKNATVHIEQALARLQDGGRLVAVVGKGMADDAASFKSWWRKIKSQYNVRANVGIDGKNYRKYGTTFDVQLVVIDKNGPTVGATLVDSFENLEDAIKALGGVKNERSDITTEQTTGQQGSKTAITESWAESRPEPAAPIPTDVVGAEIGETGVSSEREQVRTTRPDGASGKVGVSDRPKESNKPVARPRARRGSKVGGSKRVETDTKPDRGSDVPSRSSVGGAGTSDQSERIRVEAKEQDKREVELTEAVYEEYVPQKLRVPGAKPHKAKLVQSSAMATVEPPNPTYTPNLPKKIIESGDLSIAQLEAVVYAGQAHQQILPGEKGYRKGFLIGDGTGVGKGREIAAIILDNMRQGRKKALWISKNNDLAKDAQRDYGDVGGNAESIFSLSSIKPGQEIEQEDGILFTTYNTLRMGTAQVSPGVLTAKKGVPTRLDQIVAWLGEDFDGVIAFDESHNMGNAIGMKGKRGVSRPSARALAGLELQRRLPKARVVYVSATAATEVHNLAYAERLGLWGEETPFADVRDFVDQISAGGIAAMELIAKDMKAMGSYVARSISYDGVEYSTLEHKLDSTQKEIYDAMAKGWQVVLQNVNQALETTGQKENGRANGQAIGQFWSAQQRFFNQVLTSMQMPSVIAKIYEDLAAGHSVVLQLVNTNEAITTRQLANMDEDQALEDLDMTPRDILMEYLDKSFPIYQYEEYTDEDGNKRSRLVVDSQNKPVINRTAEQMKEKLMAQLGSMKVPEGPLEMLINEFGTKNVAEVTGRTKRIVKVRDSKGIVRAHKESRSVKSRMADVTAFMADKKRILVFSDAGGTGQSFHASLAAKNQRKRIHYLVQPGWRADNAVQGFGRTHRTNQAQPPEYILVTTDLKGQKRFMSSIARRLDQLGALTKGQRQTGSQGLFSAKDNLESDMAKDALSRFYNDLLGLDGSVPGINGEALLTKMGIYDKLVDPETKQIKIDADEFTNTNKFLNRILALDSTEQNQVFEEFGRKLDEVVDLAIAPGVIVGCHGQTPPLSSLSLASWLLVNRP